MSRSYRIYSLADPKKAERIMREISKVEGVERIAISHDLKEMDIEITAGRVSAAMERVVNICSRISNGCEIRYKFC